MNFNGNFPYADLYNGESKGEKKGRTVPVKSFQANAWGLYQIHGNVLEWCLDYSRRYPENSNNLQPDPMGPLENEYAALRGGGWLSYARSCRSANRQVSGREDLDSSIGVRPCGSITGQSARN